MPANFLARELRTVTDHFCAAMRKNVVELAILLQGKLSACPRGKKVHAQATCAKSLPEQSGKDRCAERRAPLRPDGEASGTRPPQPLVQQPQDSAVRHFLPRPERPQELPPVPVVEDPPVAEKPPPCPNHPDRPRLLLRHPHPCPVTVLAVGGLVVRPVGEAEEDEYAALSVVSAGDEV